MDKVKQIAGLEGIEKELAYFLMPHMLQEFGGDEALDILLKCVELYWNKEELESYLNGYGV